MIALAAAVALGLAAGPVDLDQAKKAGAAAADAWVALVDAGKLDEAWKEAAPGFQSGVTREEWTRKVGGARTPLGAVATRKFQSARFTETMPGAPDGNYVVVTYVTDFAKKKGATEHVITSLDADDRWKTSGYWIQ